MAENWERIQGSGMRVELMLPGLFWCCCTGSTAPHCHNLLSQTDSAIWDMFCHVETLHVQHLSQFLVQLGPGSNHLRIEGMKRSNWRKISTYFFSRRKTHTQLHRQARPSLSICLLHSNTWTLLWNASNESVSEPRGGKLFCELGNFRRDSDIVYMGSSTLLILQALSRKVGGCHHNMAALRDRTNHKMATGGEQSKYPVNW